MSADLQRIGWLRSAILVCACAFLAFAAWSASGANVGSSHEADVKVRPVQTRPAPADATPAPRMRVKQRAATAAQAPAPARTHLCTAANGHDYRVDARIRCLKITSPSGKLLDRARQHKTIITPVKPAAPAPGAASPQPKPGATAPGSTPTTPKPSEPPAEPAPKQPAPGSGTGGAQAPPP